MVDNLVSLDKFRVVRKQDDDEFDEQWKNLVLENLDRVKAKILSGETTGLVMVELEDEISHYKLHMLGLQDYDIFTTVGLLENVKVQLLDALYEE